MEKSNSVKTRILPAKLKLATTPSMLSDFQEKQISNHFKINFGRTKEFQNNQIFQTSRHLSDKIIKSSRAETPIQLGIEYRKKNFETFLTLSNIKQRKISPKTIFSRTALKKDTLKIEDSFTKRYSPEKNQFFHKLIGKINLPRKPFTIYSDEIKEGFAYKNDKTSELLKIHTSASPIINITGANNTVDKRNYNRIRKL